MDTRIDHPLDIELLEYSRGGGAQAAGISDHLGVCLLCRIRLGRIRRAQPAASPLDMANPEVSQRVLAVLATERMTRAIAPGQIWLAGEARRMLIWVRAVLDNAVSVYAVTLDVEAADDTTLIVDKFGAIGHPVAIVTSVVGTVPKERLAICLGELDVRRELEHISGAPASGLTAGFATGAPITRGIIYLTKRSCLFMSHPPATMKTWQKHPARTSARASRSSRLLRCSPTT